MEGGIVAWVVNWYGCVIRLVYLESWVHYALDVIIQIGFSLPLQ